MLKNGRGKLFFVVVVVTMKPNLDLGVIGDAREKGACEVVGIDKERLEVLVLP